MPHSLLCCTAEFQTTACMLCPPSLAAAEDGHGSYRQHQGARQHIAGCIMEAAQLLPLLSACLPAEPPHCRKLILVFIAALGMQPPMKVVLEFQRCE